MEHVNYTNSEQERKENRTWLIFTGCVAGVGLALGLYSHHQMRKTVNLFNKAVKDIETMTVVDVKQSMIDRAITNACNKQIGNAVNRIIQSTENDIHTETMKRVDEAVKLNYGKIKSVVADTIAKQAEKIDQSEIMTEATEKAKELLVSRFDGKLDTLMSDYQRNLDNVGKIYQSIASSMAEKSGKDVTLKLG